MNLSWIKKVYLYLVSLISLVILVIASIMLINLALKTWVFTKADDSYYYPPKLDCPANLPDDASKSEGIYVDPGCSDPNYVENERKAEMDRRAAQKQRDAATAIAMIIVAAPVFYYHWKLARKES